MSGASDGTRLSLDERRHAAADARGSVLAEGLDPAGIDDIVDACVRGAIDTDELLALTRDCTS